MLLRHTEPSAPLTLLLLLDQLLLREYRFHSLSEPVFMCFCACLCSGLSPHGCLWNQALFLSRTGEGMWRLWQLWFLNNKLVTKSQSCISSSHTPLSFAESAVAYTSDGTGTITSALGLRLRIQMWLTAPRRVTSENSKQLSRLFCFEKQAFDANSSIIVFAILIASDFLLFLFEVEQCLFTANVVEENPCTILVPRTAAGWGQPALNHVCLGS